MTTLHFPAFSLRLRMNQPIKSLRHATVPRIVELEQLLGLFPDAQALGVFHSVSARTMPDDYQRLLAHNDHMTLAVEAFHGCSVDVEVLQSRRDGSAYTREILLRRTNDRAIVQYGLVRLQLSALDERTQNEILSEKIPLGRVLIEHNVLREVELVELWRIEMGPKLASFFRKAVGEATYGRTAMIYLDDQPALELLEIVTA